LLNVSCLFYNMKLFSSKSRDYLWFVWWLSIILIVTLTMAACKLPSPEKKNVHRVKHNYIVLLDLSDRLIVQQNQPERDKQIIKSLYGLFEEKVRKDLYIKSRDEIKVVIAPQTGSGIKRDEFEDRLYINMQSLNNVTRKAQEEQQEKSLTPTWTHSISMPFSVIILPTIMEAISGNTFTKTSRMIIREIALQRISSLFSQTGTQLLHIRINCG